MLHAGHSEPQWLLLGPDQGADTFSAFVFPTTPSFILSGYYYVRLYGLNHEC